MRQEGGGKIKATTNGKKAETARGDEKARLKTECRRENRVNN